MFLHCELFLKNSIWAADESLPIQQTEVPSSGSVSVCRRSSKDNKPYCSTTKYHTDHATKRKESVLSPISNPRCSRTSFPGSFSASLTVEAAIELPLFFVLIAIVLQFAMVFYTAAQYAGYMTTTAQEMAMAAYKEEYGDANHLIRGALSDAWASSQVIGKAEDPGAVRNASFLNSSYMKEGDRIRLVLTYQAKPKYSLITLPFTFFVQKAVVRGWTGAKGSANGAAVRDAADSSNRTVYVTDSGTVYHTDPNCSHLKVTVIPTTEEGLTSARNKSGSKYKKCPHCGRSGAVGGQYYIDPYGERWHTSLSCPSLKRSVNTVTLDACEHLRECADCKKRRGG